MHRCESHAGPCVGIPKPRQCKPDLALCRIDRQCWEVVGAVSIRRLQWRMAPPLALSVAVGVVLALLLIFRWGGEGAVRTVDSLTLLALSTYATVCAVLAARCAHGSGRRAWTMMAVALAAWTVGDLIWSSFAITLGRNPFPSPADGCYVAFTLLAWPAMALFPTRAVTGVAAAHSARWRHGDAVPVSAHVDGRATRYVRQLRPRGSRHTRCAAALSDRRRRGADHGSASRRAGRIATNDGRCGC